MTKQFVKITGLPGNEVMRYGSIRNLASTGNHSSIANMNEFMLKVVEKGSRRYTTFSEVLNNWEDQFGHADFVMGVYLPQALINGCDFFYIRNEAGIVHIRGFDSSRDSCYSEYIQVDSSESLAETIIYEMESWNSDSLGEDCVVVAMFDSNNTMVHTAQALDGSGYRGSVRDSIRLVDAPVKEVEKKVDVAVEARHTTTVSNPNKEENKIMSKVSKVVDLNKSAAMSAARITAGKIAIKNVTKAVGGKLPIMVRGYADTAIGQLVIANIFKFAVDQYAPQHKAAGLVADSMIEGAMISALEGLNIEGLIESVLKGVNLESLTAPVGEEE